MKALVAMSGGVDSSVAAALMLEEGHEVVGVTIKQWVGSDGRLPTAGCCTVADAEDARRVAARLDVPHYVLDHVEDFTSEVVDRFVAGYVAGTTPNPCIECNRRVRFGTLLDRVEDLGCDVLVTGHHARVERRHGRTRLLRGTDPGKDQSYVLHMLSGDQLERVRLPIGDMTKDEVRAHADRLGLRTASKPDSQDLCFVDGDYRAFLRERAVGADRPGEIVDASGEVVGAHKGVADFTIGQRRGLGVALGSPRYVVDVDPVSARVTIGERHDLQTSTISVGDVTFAHSPPASGSRVEVQVRYRGSAAPAVITDMGDGWQVAFEHPQDAVAPGQSAVFFAGDEVLGGGRILKRLAA